VGRHSIALAGDLDRKKRVDAGVPVDPEKRAMKKRKPEEQSLDKTVDGNGSIAQIASSGSGTSTSHFNLPQTEEPAIEDMGEPSIEEMLVIFV
jgi:hypothetical protein